MSPLLIACVLLDDTGQLQILVHPRMREIVTPEDWNYVDSLFKDFRIRARSDESSLFKQISSLNFGPLVTEDAGGDLTEHAHFAGDLRHFVPYVG